MWNERRESCCFLFRENVRLHFVTMHFTNTSKKIKEKNTLKTTVELQLPVHV